jgi:hypothetical protein
MMIHSGSEPSPIDHCVRRVSAYINAPVITSHSPSRFGMQFPTSAYQDSKFLSPSFTNQFQSMSTNSTTKSPGPTHTMNTNQYQDLEGTRPNTWIESRNECYNTTDTASKKRRLDAHSSGGKQFKPIPAIPVSQDGTSASGSSQSEDRANLASPNEVSTNFVGISPHRVSIGKSESIGSDHDIPDLLVGFDKHIASMKKTSAEATAAATKHRPIPEDSHFFAGPDCGESPYITSKSFDELHRYLGIGLSSDKMPYLDLNDHHHHCAPKPNGGYQLSTVDFRPSAHMSAYTQPNLDAPARYLYRPSSSSNCSDLTCSD